MVDPSDAGVMGDLEEEYNIKWNNHSHEALHVVNQLRAHDAFADVLLFCDDSWFKANKMILAACSGYFQHLFLEMQSKFNQARAPAVVAMRETRADLLQLALDFMYKVLYRQPGLLCTPRQLCTKFKIFRKNIFFGTKITSEAFFKQFSKFEGHTTSGMRTIETLNLLKKL
jgi:hypothetical protein